MVLLAATAAGEVVLFLVLRDQVSGFYNLDYISLTDKLVVPGSVKEGGGRTRTEPTRADSLGIQRNSYRCSDHAFLCILGLLDNFLLAEACFNVYRFVAVTYFSTIVFVSLVVK